MSIYREVLGPAFERLHPQIQKRFGFGSADCVAAIGTGVMDELWLFRRTTLFDCPLQGNAHLSGHLHFPLIKNPMKYWNRLLAL
jgi:hypothetical protein